MIKKPHKTAFCSVDSNIFVSKVIFKFYYTNFCIGNIRITKSIFLSEISIDTYQEFGVLNRFVNKLSYDD